MRLVIDNATRFFAVVGAPYIPEHHFDAGRDGAERRGSPSHAHDVAALPPSSGSPGWWLHEER